MEHSKDGKIEKGGVAGGICWRDDWAVWAGDAVEWVVVSGGREGGKNEGGVEVGSDA